MLEMAVLGLLKGKDMHGYELKQRLSEQLGFFRQFSYGSLYPTLKRLSREGAIEVEYPMGESSRRKNVYRITPKGEQLFRQLLEETSPNGLADRDAFMLRFAFSRYMEPETRRRMLEGRRGVLQERLTKVSTSLKKMRDRLDAYSLELMEYGMNETEHDIRWLNQMLAAETQGAARTKPRRRRAVEEAH